MSGTVTVCCRMPNGIALHLDDHREVFEQVMGGGTRKITRFFKRNQPDVRLRGWALERNNGIQSIHPDVVGTCGLTHNVSEDFWNAWVEQNKDSDLVRNNIVFAQPKPESAKAKAREFQSETMGLEPLDPGTVFVGGREMQRDKRWPNKISQGTNKPVE